MKFGVCQSLDQAVLVAEMGYDYIETGFKDIARWSEEELEKKMEVLKKSGISCEAANCFLPPDLLLNSGMPDWNGLEKFTEVGMKRGAAMGLKAVVFGSGGARKALPESDLKQLYKTIIYFLREIASPIAAEYGVTIVIEPLQKVDSNIINRVTEGVLLAAAVDRDNVTGLADLFHMHMEHDDSENLLLAKGHIGHAHIANPNGRGYPLNPFEYDYKRFIQALKEAGCPRCSIEANTPDFASDGLRAIKILKEL